MDRRKFLTAIGSLAAGGAAAIGTGAFTSVTAERSVDVEVAADANAFLSLSRVSGSANSSAYVTGNPSNDTVAFDFSTSNGATDLGNGFNKNAVTEVDDLLKVKNQGTQDIYFYVDVTDIDLSDGTSIEIEATQGGANKEDNIAVGGNSSGTSDVEIKTGNSVVLDLIVDTTGIPDSALPPLSDDGSVTFHADATDDI